MGRRDLGVDVSTGTDTDARADTDVDVLVAGDGPAAAAAVHALRLLGADVIAVGPGGPWTSTYACWRDEVAALPDHCFESISTGALVRARTDRSIDREYAVIDRDALRAHLGLDAVLRVGRVATVTEADGRVEVRLDDDTTVTAAWLVDARGAGCEATAWQTAFGVEVDDTDLERLGLPADRPTVMAWLPNGPIPVFLYAIPVGDRWLAQATSLAADPAVSTELLRECLVERLGERVVERAESSGRCEVVRIPLGGRRSATGRIVPFGAAAGLVHPATGYSVAASVAAAPRLARALVDGEPADDPVWDRRRRRTRAMHDAGLDTLLRLDVGGTIELFETFFALPESVWGAYLDVGAPPGRVMVSMGRIFAAAPWSVRRRLIGAVPAAVRVRPGGS